MSQWHNQSSRLGNYLLSDKQLFCLLSHYSSLLADLFRAEFNIITTINFTIMYINSKAVVKYKFRNSVVEGVVEPTAARFDNEISMGRLELFRRSFEPPHPHPTDSGVSKQNVKILVINPSRVLHSYHSHSLFRNFLTSRMCIVCTNCLLRENLR